ncbi:YjcZ family sporulation protein [Paenibacillus albiflavus]
MSCGEVAGVRCGWGTTEILVLFILLVIILSAFCI